MEGRGLDTGQGENDGGGSIASENENSEPMDMSDTESVPGPLDVFNFPNAFFHLELRKTKSFKHQKEDIVDEHSYIARLRENAVSDANATLGDIHNQIHHMFDSLLNEINDIYSPNDLVRVFITHEEMVNTNIVVGPDYLGNISPQIIMDQISDVIRSNNFIPADRNLVINVAAIRNIQGLRSSYIINMARDLARKGCIISIKNEDDLCLPRAIAVAVALNRMIANPTDLTAKRNYNTMRQNDRVKTPHYPSTSLQKCTALKYQRKAGLKLGKVGLLTDIPAYEDSLEFGINVISARGGNKKVYNGNKKYKSQIYLYHVQKEGGSGHFSVLRKVHALLSRSYYCDECDTGFNNNDRHRCKVWCEMCGRKGCKDLGSSVSCTTCHGECRSPECLDNHQSVNRRSGKSKCDMLLFCPRCRVQLRKNNKNRSLEKHICGESYCRNCQVYYYNEHQCHMRSITARPEGSIPEKKFIFYDFESMQTNSGNHVPNLVVSHSICDQCQDVTDVKSRSRCSNCGHRCEICSQKNKDGTRFAMEQPCKSCGQREMIFQGSNTVREFCEWLISPLHKNFTVIAHNSRAYDCYFLYNYMLENSIVPQIIFRGSKIIYCHISKGLNLRFLDSLNFLNMPLSQLPKSFGLTELKKGFFPHLYNHEDIIQLEQNVKRDTLPDMNYYDVDSMRKERRVEFLEWYELNKNDKFDLFSELLEYCRSDVNILLCACWKFRQLVMECTGPTYPVDPYDYTTIASVCMGIFRSKFMEEEWKVLLKKNSTLDCSHEWNCFCTWTKARKTQGDLPLEILDHDGTWRPVTQDMGLIRSKFVKSPIGLPPPHGYARRDNFSMQSMEWIKWYEVKNRVTIRHALSDGGEKKVFTDEGLTYYLDGYFVDEHGMEHALEFNGCWFHGCPSCYPRDRKNLRIGGKNMDVRYMETLNKEQFLRDKGMTVHSIWSCDWESVKKSQSCVQDFVKGLKITKPIELRDSYFGGRTNGIILKQDIKAPEKGHYLDFCSLYPDVLKYMTYSSGHPVRIIKDFAIPTFKLCEEKCSIRDCSDSHWKMPYFGLIKATVLPPRNLLFPILPMRINNKLMFTLCHRCCTDENIDHLCMCSDLDRRLNHTWTTIELEAAINVGYQIIEIHEVLHWPDCKSYDPDKGQGGLFTKYINTFLQIKAESSGLPRDVDTEDKIDGYIEEYARNEGVHLRKDMIQKNPGLRSIAKLALNSFYGKFGQKTNMKKCAYLTSAKEIYKFLTDDTKVIKDFHVLNSDMVLIDYVKGKEFEDTDSKTNVVIASFCTSYARLKLWNVLRQIGNRVLYHDTDSVIFTGKPGDYFPDTGKFLGELTDELTCKDVDCLGCNEGHWIVDFVSCGAKNYAYRLNTGQVVCKVRGFSLNYSASQIINLESMKKALVNWKNKVGVTEMTTVKTMILRNKHKAIVYSKEMAKNYGVVYNKRVVKEDYTTVPYGYVESGTGI